MSGFDLLLPVTFGSKSFAGRWPKEMDKKRKLPPLRVKKLMRPKAKKPTRPKARMLPGASSRLLSM